MAGYLRLLIISVFTLLIHDCWAKPSDKHDLFTNDELAWIEKNPSIRVSNSTDLPPLAFKKDGQVVGYSIDYIDLISQITGLAFVFEYQEDWSEQLQQAEERQLDMLQLVRERDSIGRFMDFTQPYISGGSTVLYGREGQPRVSSIGRIKDQPIAVRRDFLEQRYLSTHYPNLNLIIVESTGEGLNAVLGGEAEYFICAASTCETYIYQNFLSNLEIVGSLGIAELEKQNQSRFATRNDWPELNSIINKAIAAITAEQKQMLRDKWFDKNNRQKLLIETLTDEERDWIESHSRIAFSLPLKLPPFAYVIDDQPKGIADDFVRRFEKEYAIEAHFIAYDSWSDIVNAVMSGEIDFVPGMNITKERKQSLLFTDPFIEMPAAIYTKSGRAIYSTLQQAKGKKIGLAKGSAWMTPIKRDFPGLLVVEYAKLDDALLALSNEEVDLTVVNTFVAKHHIVTLGLDDLVRSGTTQYRQATAIAVHPSKPELVSLFNKVIASVDESQMTLILEKWNNIQVIEKNPWRDFIGWTVLLVFAVIFIILLFNYLNRRKSIRVIKKVSHRLSNAQRVAKLGSWDVDSDGTITSLSVEAAQILGVAETKSMKRIDYVQMIYNQDRKRYLKNIDDALESGLLNVEYRIIVNDKLKWVKEVSELKFNNNNQFVSANTTIQDISEFKKQQEKLIESQDELRVLTSKLLSVQEEERKRVARDLHDDLSQRLAVVAIDLGAVQMSVESESLMNQIKGIKQALGKIAEDTHSLSRRLHPSILDDLGLIDALRSEVQSFELREKIKVEFIHTSRELNLPKDVALVLFRIVQEGLRNIAKYSEANKARVSFTLIKDTLVLQIRDDGMGFDVEQAKRSPGLGLQSMMERAKLINGELHIHSEENKGTTIELSLAAPDDFVA
ncbi:sensor histidine kinase [Vibrio comitans]|uniref:histidine kinase n=1 Tax=Vibrio comitans NBRC 102076 TaxID=1219078 RepID=A0A4Y3ISY2_9VIBR|nr:transporter substrate-binding domain-containing protein [Vibrio comitans]GEA61908.1 hypothetical protein VCO01S_31010 [Vibrio comitans NBRC 102076]